ncbi:uncharacterized protein EV420DRAFT_1562250 [Desarmillaria tabescens]|uniref:DUF6699 domain-containing protein n=1 Tax=Armillaria tabescens TaxID=1929756 RepID=A0AA39JZB4_ARMTA|nr:uncharacterized protein EV420DRAFT_1562250 [Desarmillaria tabescens]KAK0450540.1 hypothetical protein EV420DRAFT_1562250 [Desarmillaria tabescens]
MPSRLQNVAAMATQQGRKAPELYSSPPTAFYTPSKAPFVIPVYSNTQLTTTVPVHRHDARSPDASYTRSVRECIAPSPPPVLGKPRHCHIPLPSQIESDSAIVVHPLLRPSRGEMMIELDFAHSLASVRVFSHDGCVNEAATNPPLPSLAIVHPMLPWPVVIHRSGHREWVTVADVVETLWQALQMPIPLPKSSSSSSLFVENEEDALFTSVSDWEEREKTVLRLVYLRGKTRFMGLQAVGSDTWELIVA